MTYYVSIMRAGSCGTTRERRGALAAALALALAAAWSGGSCAQEVPPPLASDDDEGMVLGYRSGSPDAPVRVMEFSDYGCGYCRQFHIETFPMVKEEFIDAGKVAWTFLPFASGLFLASPAATRAAQCVLEQGSEPFERFDDELWTKQREWKNASDAEEVVRSLAERAGAAMAGYDECLADDRSARRLAHNAKLARSLGVRGTPTFYVEGFRPIEGAPLAAVFRDMLNAAYEAVREPG